VVTRLGGRTESTLGTLQVVPPMPATRRQPAPLRTAYVLSWLLVPAMIAASLMGLFVHGLYQKGAWAREALRGGDLVSLVVVAPLLAASLVLAMRRSRRALPVWLGCLAYAAYNYAFYAFGATFNDAFLLHIASMSLAVYAIWFALLGLGPTPVARAPRAPRAAGWFLAVVGCLQDALWLFVIVRNAVTGEVIHDVPVAGQHLVLALDLGLAMPAMVLAGVLLIRRRPLGFLLGPAMAVMGAAYQLNLMVAGVFQANADVAGVRAFAPEGVVLTAAFVLTALVLLLGSSGRTVRPSYDEGTHARSAG
jgi:hypothetical protein